MSHSELVQAAHDAIQAVHDDTSVDMSKNISSLRSLISEIDILIEALEETEED